MATQMGRDRITEAIDATRAHLRQARGGASIIVAADTMRDIQQGKRWPGPEAPSGQPLCRAYSTAGDMIALLEHEVGVNLWRPRKVFAVGQ